MGCNVTVQKVHWYGLKILLWNIKMLPLAELWWRIKEEYTQLSERVKSILLFPMIYLCEAKFSSYTIQPKQNNVTQQIECITRHDNPAIFYYDRQ